MVMVKFKSSWSCYFSGDVAGFELATAADLVDKKKVAAYVEPLVVEDDNHDESHGDELTLTKFSRMNLEELVAIAKEKNIDLGEATLKKDVQPIVKKALFPDAE